jgi:hypothetical protein
VAVFSKLRLYDVALQLGWSPDTVKRYVAVFRALGLVLHYHDRRREVTLHIPLGPYTPLTNFTALDELTNKRQKQQQLALKIKTRYIVRFGDPSRMHSVEMRTSLQELKAILDDEPLEPLKRQRLQIKIADLFTQLAGKTDVGDLNQRVVTSQEGTDVLHAGGSKSEGDPNADQGDLKPLLSPTLPPQSEPQGDSKRALGDQDPQHTIHSPLQREHLGDSKRTLGDLEQTIALTPAHADLPQGDPNADQGDFISSSTSPTTTSSRAQVSSLGDSEKPSGDFKLSSPLSADTMGDQIGTVVQKLGDSNVNLANVNTYNVNFIINNINGGNVIRKKIAQFLASKLEELEFENGYPTFSKYLRAFHRYSPEVIGRAFLATMVLVHRKRWKKVNRGATFTNQCKILCGQMPLAHYTLDDVESWLQSWGNLPYSDLIDAIAAPLPKEQPEEPAALVTAPRQETSGRRNGPLSSGTKSTRGKRTYGLQYTGRPVTINKGTHNLGSPTPPNP